MRWTHVALGVVLTVLTACRVEIVDPLAAPEEEPATVEAPAEAPPDGPAEDAVASVEAPPPEPGRPSRPASRPPPPPPAEPLPDLVLRNLALDPRDASVAWEVANVGPGPLGAPGAPVEVVVRVDARAPGAPVPAFQRDLKVPLVLPPGGASRQRLLLADVAGHLEVLSVGGPLQVVAIVNPDRAVLEVDVANNRLDVLGQLLGRTTTVVVPVPALPPPPPPPAVTFRSTDGEWASVYLDGEVIWYVRAGEREHTLRLEPGTYTLEIKDFMEHETWSKGRLVVRERDLRIGITKGRHPEVYNDERAYSPR